MEESSKPKTSLKRSLTLLRGRWSNRRVRQKDQSDTKHTENESDQFAISPITSQDSSSSTEQLDPPTYASIEQDQNKPPLQPFRFLDLPLEIKGIIYTHYFPSQETTIKVQKRSELSETQITNHWNNVPALLYTCKEIYETAKPFLKEYMKVDLDLRAYYTSHWTTLPIEDIVRSMRNISQTCTRLIVRNDQHLERLKAGILPNLDTVLLYDFQSFRYSVLDANSTLLCKKFEKEARRILQARAQWRLRYLEDYFPLASKEVLFICDCLICTEMDVLTPKQDKLRHYVKFDTAHPDGILTLKGWIKPGVFADPCPLADQIAPHVHEYCLHLQEKPIK